MAETPDRSNAHYTAAIDVKNPISTTIAIILSVVTLVLTLAGSIGASAAIALSAQSHAEMAARKAEANTQALKRSDAALRERELTASVRTAIPTCQALIGLDDAKNGASNASSDPHSYGHNLARAITNVVDKTHCRVLITEVKEGVPLTKIVQQEQQQTDGFKNK